MKVLQICSKPPRPSVDGGCKATNNITEGLLSNNIQVKILTLSTHKHPFQKEKLSEKYIQSTQIEHVFIDTRVKLLPALVHFCSSRSYNLSRFFCKKFEDLIVLNLKKEKYDIVLLEGLFVTDYLQAIRKYTDAKVIMRSHNVEFEIWERSAESEKNPIKKFYQNHLAKQLKRDEVIVLNELDAIASITYKDKKKFIELGCKKPINVIPFGINLNDYQVNQKNNQFDFFHIGSMDWVPNQQAIKWFLEKVWSQVEIKHPEALINIAGKKMPDWLREWKQHNVKIVGEVPNAVDFINENKIMIAPLFSGSGMRVKIIEAMALGKVVIATDIAMEGIDVEHKKNVLIADTADDFVQSINWCMENLSQLEVIGNNARKLIEEKYDNAVIIKKLIDLF